MKKLATSVAALLLTAAPTFAADPSAAMAQYVRDAVMSWASDPEIVSAVVARNAQTGGLSEPEIIAMDNTWRAEVGTAATPTIDSVLATSASDFLRQQLSASEGLITEVFVMDMVGLNVASSGVTSDYWQGDEAKFQKTHGVGPAAVHVGDVEFDESAQTYQGQVSFTLTDPATGQVIGAVTVGLNAEAFF
jgi:hypothetical protein